MKHTARSVLAVVVATLGFAMAVAVLPQAGGLVTDAVAGEPTPLTTSIHLPDSIVPSPTPSPSPSGDPDDKRPNDSKNGSGDEGSDGQEDDFDHEDGDVGTLVEEQNKKKGGGRIHVPVFVGVHRAPGAFNTDRLVAIAIRLRSLGWSEERVNRRVYAPFIIGGEAAWIDTWGALRHGPEPDEIRSHEGQDVFCEEGTPVLAAELGTIEFGEGGLGGRVVRLYREDGTYWYYAHLSDWNLESFSSGDEVEAGDVIGYCGRTGNAQTTPPHVHFGWYEPDGSARDPFATLKSWLEEAEEAAFAELKRAAIGRITQLDRLTTARRFGDLFAPSGAVYLSDEELQRMAMTRLMARFSVRAGVKDPHDHGSQEHATPQLAGM